MCVAISVVVTCFWAGGYEKLLERMRRSMQTWATALQIADFPVLTLPSSHITMFCGSELLSQSVMV